MKTLRAILALFLSTFAAIHSLQGQTLTAKKINPASGSINDIMLGPLDNNLHTDNNKQLTIGWDYTPDIGDQMKVEYQLESSGSWELIDEVAVSDKNPVVWVTPTSGYYPSVRIRLTSSSGTVFTSYPFSIGATDAVYRSPFRGNLLSVYPNPAREELHARLQFANDAWGSIDVLDMLGRVVMQSRAATNLDLSLDIHTLPSGVYLLRSVIGSEILSYRFSVVR
jgi:hypothetical protein